MEELDCQFMRMKKVRRPLNLCSALTLVAVTAGFAADWPQYRGPQGNGVTTEKIQIAWPSGDHRYFKYSSAAARVPFLSTVLSTTDTGGSASAETLG